MSATNGGPDPQDGMAQMPMMQIGVVTQYVKDFSFENPNAPRSMAPSTQQPAININIAVEAAPLTETDCEVTLRLDGRAESQGLLLFGFELLYAGVFRILNVPPESLQPTVMIECPAAVVSVRARNHRHRDAEWRVSAAAFGAGRFRLAVSPALGGDTADSTVFREPELSSRN